MPWHVAGRLLEDALSPSRAVRRAHEVRVLANPDRHVGRAGLGMELETERPAPEAEHLVFAREGAREQLRAVGYVEGIAVPVEHQLALAEAGEARLGVGRRGEGHGTPSDLSMNSGRIAHPQRTHAGAEGVGHELCAQADAEHGAPILQQPAEQLDLGPQEWPASVADVADAHAAAHDDERIAVR